MNQTIDLRSDTVTLPTDAMRQAMCCAEVGDDMTGDDPTVNRLESLMTSLFGMEAAVFACSGTQSNQMGVRVHCVPGDELLINETGHIANFEGGAPAALSGVTVRTIARADGKLDLEQLEGRVRVDDQHFCRTRLVCLENTTNLGGGLCYSLKHMQRVSDWALSQGLKRHLDGARLFNAMVREQYSAVDVGRCFDTISICFSKGLGCPMGSVLLGTRDDIRKARRIRKMFGGGLRQAGIVAAAAIHAMEHHVARLADDHANARLLAQLLSDIDGIETNPDAVETNLVYFRIADHHGTAVQLASALQERGIRIGPMGGCNMRAVTHLNISEDDVRTVAAAVAACLAEGIAHRPLLGSGPFAK